MDHASKLKDQMITMFELRLDNEIHREDGLA
jgi:hypothetical protein